MIEKLIKRLARRAGVEIGRYRPYGARRMNRLRRDGISTVLDVGANAGLYGSDLRHSGYTGRIVSFEPLTTAFAQLSDRAAEDDAWECHNIALGEGEGEATINIASNVASSSLLAMSDDFDRSVPDVSYIDEERVRLRRLDALGLEPSWPTLLKIDVQGYERQVLDGATGLLTSVALVECEVSIARLYEGQPSFREMIDLLSDAGFELVDLDPFFYDRTDGRVLAVDALFARADQLS